MLWLLRVRLREALLYWPDIYKVVFGLLFIWLYNLSDFQWVSFEQRVERRTSVQ